MICGSSLPAKKKTVIKDGLVQQKDSISKKLLNRVVCCFSSSTYAAKTCSCG